jgi:outer membrane cobalamin receptor
MNRSILLFILLAQSLFAQNTFSGKVLDAKQNPLAGVNIYLLQSYNGTTTSKGGTFSLTDLPKAGKIEISMMGFDSQFIDLEKTDFQGQQTIILKESFNTLKAVTITAGSIEVSDKRQAIVLKPLDIVTTSGALGDVIGALNTLPGTSTNANDGRLFVRGGSADETALFVDGLRLGSAYGSSLSGIPTRGRFNPNLFKGNFFSTGAYSAEYGQALSSVLSLYSVDMPVRSQTDLSISSVGASAAHTEVWEDQSLSTNLSYTNLSPYMNLVPQNVQFNTAPQGLDTELLYRNKIGKNTFLKGFYSYQNSRLAVKRHQIDKEELESTSLKNDFHYANLNLKHSWQKKHLLNAGISYTNNSDNIQLDSSQIKANNQLAHFKVIYQYFPMPRLKIKSGLESIHENLKQGLNGQSRFFEQNLYAAFAEANYHFNSDLVLQIGLRNSVSQGENSLMPRFSLAYRLNEKSQIALAYGDYVQNQNPSILINQNNLTASSARHWVLNYQFATKDLTFRLEAYHKKYDQLLRFDESYTSNGEGYAQGFDLFIRDRKSIKNLDYWFSYSFIDTKRHWKSFSTQVQPSFAPKHNASLVGKYWISRLNSQVGSSFNINDGYRYENPNLAGEMESKTKAFSSLNISWSYLPKPNLIIHFEITNALGRENIFGYQYSANVNANGNYSEMAIPQSAKRFIFIGVFYTLSSDKKANQLNNL